ncbi:MAG TPA: S-methyl-5'-thioadenosine phosphorylase, partial [Desulfuromonadaceae bacterium]
MGDAVIGVIGGSGLYEMEGLEDIRRIRVETPFGEPSDEYVTGSLHGVTMAFLPRHGRGHRLLPSE